MVGSELKPKRTKNAREGEGIWNDQNVENGSDYSKSISIDDLSSPSLYDDHSEDQSSAVVSARVKNAPRSG